MKNRIKWAREKEGLTQRGLAEKCNCHWRTIQNVESGRKPSFELMFKLSEALGRKIPWLWPDAEVRK